MVVVVVVVVVVAASVLGFVADVLSFADLLADLGLSTTAAFADAVSFFFASGGRSVDGLSSAVSPRRVVSFADGDFAIILGAPSAATAAPAAGRGEAVGSGDADAIEIGRECEPRSKTR